MLPESRSRCPIPPPPTITTTIASKRDVTTSYFTLLPTSPGIREKNPTDTTAATATNIYGPRKPISGILKHDVVVPTWIKLLAKAIIRKQKAAQTRPSKNASTTFHSCDCPLSLRTYRASPSSFTMFPC